MVPSARARVRQYIAPLSKFGIAVHEYPLPWGNILPRRRSLRPIWMAATGLSRTATLTCSWRADATWISRQVLPAFAPLHPLAKHPMVLDVDDAIWLNTGGHRARDLARASDLVVCGNTFLAENFYRWNHNVTIIPTAVNTAWYRPRGAPGGDERLVVGWTGTSGNFPFLYAIEAALARVFAEFQDVRLLVIADQPPAFRLLPPARVHFEVWTPNNELAAFARMSIGLMPLADTAWCNGKCSYKMLCYMAAGIPVVVTPAGMNREVLALGEIGLGATTESEWITALSTLLKEVGLRQRMGTSGRAVVERFFSLQKLATQYAAAFTSVGAA
jgi:glycosyltransferase involved in cell wall biosynthesis